MATLSLTDIKQIEGDVVVVEVPEFGEGMTVNVHGLTVEQNTMLVRKLHANPKTSSVPIVAALAARDDNGNLVFGETEEEAIVLVGSLPSKYFPAVMRIFNVASDLMSSKPGAAEKN